MDPFASIDEECGKISDSQEERLLYSHFLSDLSPADTIFHSSPGDERGALITAGVLTAGLISFRQGNSQLGQKLMRARVLAQGATVALMVGSAYYYGKSLKGSNKVI